MRQPDQATAMHITTKPPAPPKLMSLEFFRYHGIWAPGVRAFRVIGIAGKSSLIASAFFVPILVLGSLFVPEKLETLRVTSLERTGLVYANETIALLRK